MRNSIVRLLCLVSILKFFMACQSNSSQKQTGDTTSTQAVTIPVPLRETVLTAEEQQALTPENVVQMLKEGNNRFIKQ